MALVAIQVLDIEGTITENSRPCTEPFKLKSNQSSRYRGQIHSGCGRIICVVMWRATFIGIMINAPAIVGNIYTIDNFVLRRITYAFNCLKICSFSGYGRLSYLFADLFRETNALFAKYQINTVYYTLNGLLARLLVSVCKTIPCRNTAERDKQLIAGDRGTGNAKRHLLQR